MHTELGRSQVEVQRCTLSWEGPRLVVHTELGRPQVEPHSWESFIPSPVKAILGHFPAFVLCRGVNCGDGRNKYHQPVDAELGPVIIDVWNRLWLSLRGKKMPAAEADLFQVYFRTPQVCLSTLHWLSGNAGLYVDPRSVDGRNADQSMAVIWLPGATLAEALHRQKTTERTLPVTRFSSKYGVRVLIKDEPQIRAMCKRSMRCGRFLMGPLAKASHRFSLSWDGRPNQYSLDVRMPVA